MSPLRISRQRAPRKVPPVLCRVSGCRAPATGGDEAYGGFCAEHRKLAKVIASRRGVSPTGVKSRSRQ